MRQGEWVVVFTTVLRPDADLDAYDARSAALEEAARSQPGFVAIRSARSDDGLGITASWWESEEAIAAWRADAAHTAARGEGIAEWYTGYDLTVARVERTSSMGGGT